MTARPRIGVRLRVDPVACDAHGYCAELLPERVTLDEWGYPMVDGTPVEGDLVGLARRAAAACPRRALLLDELLLDETVLVDESELPEETGRSPGWDGQLHTVP